MMNKKTRELENTPIKKLVISYSLPMIIAMIVNSIYNVVDRIFVGKYVGENALAGLTVVFPLMILAISASFLVAGGAAPLLSISLGQKNPQKAAKVLGNMTIATLITGVVFATVALVFITPILWLLGASEETMPFALTYIRILLIIEPLHLLAMNFASVIRAEGHPRFTTMTLVSSAVLNLILDYFFVAVFGFGIQGAAAATAISQIFGLLFLLSFYLRKKSMLVIKLSSFILDFRIIIAMAKIGISMAIMELGVSCSAAFFNGSLSKYGGDTALAAMGGIMSLYMIIIMPLFGLVQGLQPIISYNYGAGNFAREKEALSFGIFIAVTFTSITWLIFQTFPRAVLSLFLDSNSEAMVVGVRGLRYVMLFLPAVALQFVCNAYFQATNRTMEALVLSMLRKFILLIPLLVILPPIFGITGVWIATPLADGIGTIVTVFLAYRAIKGQSCRVLPVVA